MKVGWGTSRRALKAVLVGLLMTQSMSFARADGRLIREALELSGAVLFYQSNAPGVVVGAIRNGETAVVGFGRTSSQNQKSPDGATLVRVGSITKAFTGAVLASLVAEGRLKFTDRLQDRLPWDVPTRDGKQIRLIDLVTHASGLPREMADAPAADERALAAALKSSQLLFAPGDGVLYSNFAFDVLAQALARAAGKPYADALAERVLVPAGLRATGFDVAEADSARVMKGHDVDGSPIPSTPASPMLQGSGSLYSTANDMLKWLQWHLDRAATTNAEMRFLDHAAYVPRDGLNPVYGLDEAGTMDGMGLGWVIMAPTGSRPLIIQKTGGFQGTFSYLAFAPGRSVGVFVSMSQFNFGAFPAMTKIANELIEQLAPR
jgi:serine-type D-Ala-D-Ala carboxypeptidase/endopeptidase